MKISPFDDLPHRSYFFDQGLRFACQRCGACCIGEPGTIYVTAAEIKTIAKSLHQTLDNFTTQYLYPFKDSFSIKEDEQGRCLFYDHGCTIYSVRPLQCRTFPFWFSTLRSQRNWQQIKRHCPGIGTGRCHTRSEILEKIRKPMYF